MEWWSAKRNDYRLPLEELANTTNCTSTISASNSSSSAAPLQEGE
jgi:hypothetical protein